MILNKKWCPGCQAWLGRPNFNKCVSRADGLQGFCRQCHKLRTLAWRERNKERAAATHADWYLRNKDHVNARSKAWYEANKDKHAARVKARLVANPELQVEVQARRRARKRDALVEKVKAEEVWLRDLGICRLCGTPADRNDWHLEHLTPLSRGGEHSYANCAVSHPQCNWEKFNRTLAEHYGRKYLRGVNADA